MKTKTIIFIVVGLVVAGVAAGLIYYFVFRNKNTSQPPSQPPSQPGMGDCLTNINKVGLWRIPNKYNPQDGTKCEWNDDNSVHIIIDENLKFNKNDINIKENSVITITNNSTAEHPFALSVSETTLPCDSLDKNLLTIGPDDKGEYEIKKQIIIPNSKYEVLNYQSWEKGKQYTLQCCEHKGMRLRINVE